MNRIAYQFAVAITALGASAAFAGPSLAASNDVGAGKTGALIKTASHKKALPEDTVDARIAQLHEKLKITAAQEDQWSKVAKVMQENAEKLTALVKARMDNAETSTAIDDLKAYAAIASEHEDGTKRLIPPFESLYSSMSEDQKKIADATFRNHGPDGHHHAH